jgi:hypothetical protein
MEAGQIVRSETLDQMRARVDTSLRSLPDELRPPDPGGAGYPVKISPSLLASHDA